MKRELEQLKNRLQVSQTVWAAKLHVILDLSMEHSFSEVVWLYLCSGGESESSSRNQTGHQPGEQQDLRHGVCVCLCANRMKLLLSALQEKLIVFSSCQFTEQEKKLMEATTEFHHKVDLSVAIL